LILTFTPILLLFTQVKSDKIKFQIRITRHFKKRGQKVTLFPAAVLAVGQNLKVKLERDEIKEGAVVVTAQ
jgi:hypothetical protein